MKAISTLAVLTLLFIKTSFATDRIVEENGLGGTAYTTITAAVLAAVSGDRILVYPRQGGESYVGAVSLGSTMNIQIRSAVQGQRYIIDGPINLFSGCEISGAIVNGSIYTRGGTSSYIRITGCKIVNGNIGPTVHSSNYLVYADNDTVLNGKITIAKGRVSGCYIEGGNGTTAVQVINSTVITTEITSITGNHIVSHGPIAITSDNYHQYLNISNNYIHLLEMTPNYHLTDGAIQLNVLKTTSGTTNLCCNNTFLRDGAFSTAAIRIVPANTYLDIENNIMVGSFLNAVICSNPPPALFNFKYNYYTVGAVSGFTADGTNNGNATLLIDTATGNLLTGSDGINGGNPSNAYQDIDLTRNDAGCYGGSYTRANFTVAETSARVLFMNAPRTVPTNTPFAISAEGIHK